MFEARWKAAPLESVPGLAEEDLVQLQGICIKNKHCWSKPPDELAGMVNTFRLAVKHAYREAQGNRCCYCCDQLTDHGRAYDAEHVLCQSEYSKFTFTLRNLSAVCLTCNSAKSNKNVLSEQWTDISPLDVPQSSGDYSIVHPHLDEWHAHLTSDSIDRLKWSTEKGKLTISMCGLDVKNSDLLRKFVRRVDTQPDATRRLFLNPDRSDSWRRELLNVMRSLNENGEAVAIGRMADELDGYFIAQPAVT